MYNRRYFTRTYQVERKHAGLVIGPKGAGIRELKNISGVLDVRFDTRQAGDTCPLIVKALSEYICDDVFRYVQQKWTFFKSFKGSKPGLEQVFINIGKQEKIVLKSKLDVRNSKIITRDSITQRNSDKEIYLVDGYEAKTVEDNLGSLSLDNGNDQKYYWMQLNKEALTDTLNTSLKKMSAKEQRSFDLNVTPGKFAFICNKGRERQEIIPDRLGNISKQAFKSNSIQPVYSNALHRGIYETITRNLKFQGFSNLNEGSPEQFTIVHLIAGDQQEQFTVALALDENLEEVDQTCDQRISEEKKKAVENVYKAKTIQEVMGKNNLNPKISFHKLSLLLHPDKNSHPGATEAFKKLQHAYEKIKAGERFGTRALDIGDPPQPKKTIIPPKVISVKTKKKRVANITFFTAGILDTRVSLTTFQEDPNTLTSHIKDVLNQCWEKRDAEGGIPTPDGTSGIFMKCLKQVTAGHIWVKPIETEYGDAVIEVKVKEMREKIEHQKEWQDCVEIDMTIIMDDEEKETIQAEKLACYVKEIQKIWNLLLKA